MEKRIWDNIISDRDKAVYSAGGYGRRGGFGTRPAILVIDVHYNFVGDKPEPILESIKKYRTSCGEWGWEVVHRLERLLPAAREKGIPIFYTVAERRSDLRDHGMYAAKNYRGSEKTVVEGTHATEIVAEIAPQPQDFFISKRKPSAFFGTPLMSQLNLLDVDTVILTGCSTSGCIRATCVESFSYNFKTIVVEDCTFDRGETSHAVNLFDMNSKYADVIPVEEVLKYIAELPARPS